MRGENGTYFTSDNCLVGHFVVKSVLDQYCSDREVLVSMEQALNEHLLQQGFDAVIFFDGEHMLHCYDSKSFYVLQHASLPAAGAAADAVPSLSAGGPMGRRHRPRNSGIPAAPEGNWNQGIIDINAAWQTVQVRLCDEKLRCAIVFGNLKSLQEQITAPVFNTLTRLSSHEGRSRSIAVYMFPCFLGDTVTRLTEERSSHNPYWTMFLDNILRPLITNRDPDRVQVISLAGPNAAEVRNLLHLEWSRGVNIDASQFDELAVQFAGACARRDELTLLRLKLHLEQFSKQHPDEMISMVNWKEITADQHYVTARKRLEELIGLESVKQNILDLERELRSAMRASGRSAAEFPKYSSRFAPAMDRTQSASVGFQMNVVLTGSPGTGKSTVAGLLAGLYYELGLLPTEKSVPVSAAQLVSQNVGGTAMLTHSWVEQAMGGVLFVDEAYALTSNQFGREAIDQLVQDISAYEGQFAVVLAGYPDRMEVFMNANEGLSRRFPTRFRLPDYTAPEMYRLLRFFASHQMPPLVFSPELDHILKTDFCTAWVDDRDVNRWGNAGEARNLLDDMKRSSLRRAEPAGAEIVLTPEDIPERMQLYAKPQNENLEAAMKEISDMIGLDNVKKFLRERCEAILWNAEERAPGNYIFYGPPGAGKTETARRMADMLYLMHVIKRRHLVSVNAKELTERKIPVPGADPRESVPPLQRAVADARGGVLFVDEAHQLADSEAGRQIIREMVPIIEDPAVHADTCFIFAGYTVEMRHFFAVDAGLSSRIPENHRIRFEDYSAAELTQILKLMAQKRGEVPLPGYLDRSRAALERYLEHRPENFGNGRFIREIFLPDSIQARTARLHAESGASTMAEEQAHANSAGDEIKHTLTEKDIPLQFQNLAPLGFPWETRDPQQRMRELFGKQELLDYAAARRRSAEGGPRFADESSGDGLNFFFAGPSGSGRRTAVKALAGFWKEQGLLERDDVLFVSKADLEAGWVGQTAIKAQSQVDRALGGTLAVVSPQSLLPKSGSDSSFGPEAMGVILGAMGGHRNDLSVVFLDTQEGMEDVLRAFPALRGQLAHTFSFDDLSPADLEALFRLKTNKAMTFEPELEKLLPDFFVNWVSDRGGLGEHAKEWGNGLEADRLIEQLRLNWEKQNGLTDLGRRRITREMVPPELAKYLRESAAVAETSMQELEKLTGLGPVKEAIHRIERRIRRGGSTMPGHYCFLGNPGVGKTMVAKYMGGVLKAAGVLKQGQVVARTAKQLADDPSSFDFVLKLAKNGILFIDEAHQLLESAGGYSIIKRLVPVLEDTGIMSCTCIILAGYPAGIERLLQADQGLGSRFGAADAKLFFPDYTPTELLRILVGMAADAQHIPQISAPEPLIPEADYNEQSLQIFRYICAQNDPNFGNARFVRNYLSDSFDAELGRLDEKYGPTDDPPDDERSHLTAADIPAKYKRLLKGINGVEKADIPAASLRLDAPGPISADDGGRAVEALSLVTVLLDISRDGSHCGWATGCILTNDGIILTCEHVFNGGDEFRARVFTPGAVGGDYRWFPCKKLAPPHHDCDMALLRMEGKNFGTVPVRRADVPIGRTEQTLIAGYPFGDKVNGKDAENLEITHFFGRVASVQTLDGVERYYIDSSGKSGNSGSPVVSCEDGRLIGVFSGSVTSTSGNLTEEINYFYPIRYLYERFVSGAPNAAP